MPLLAAEPCVFPDQLFEAANQSCEEEQWWVLHTRPRSEKALARRLIKRQASFFLPQYRKEWRHRGRRLCSHLPLFPGYVFLFGNADSRLHALETNLVANVLSVANQQQLYADLLQVHQLINSGLPLSPEAALQPGAAVEIVSGPFAG